MNKYTDEELRAMSIALLRYKAEGQQCYLQFVSVLAMLARTTPEYIEQQIVNYSQLEEQDNES